VYVINRKTCNQNIKSRKSIATDILVTKWKLFVSMRKITQEINYSEEITSYKITVLTNLFAVVVP
jgi:hypothetical protein